jgi:hypothetical protein
MYFALVETKGLSLEEINEVFEQEHPRQYSERLQQEMQRATERIAGESSETASA